MLKAIAWGRAVGHGWYIFPFFLLFCCPRMSTLHYDVTNQPTNKQKQIKKQNRKPLSFKRNSLLLFHRLHFISALFLFMRENISILFTNIYNSLSSVDAHLGEKWTIPLNVLPMDRGWSSVSSPASAHFQSPRCLVTILQPPKGEFTALVTGQMFAL